MQFNIQVDSTSVLRTLEELGQERQGPFILARGLNLIAKQIQASLFVNLDTNLTIRRKGWTKQQIKIDTGTWATKTKLSVVIHLTPLATFLSDFEKGAEHLPVNGRSWLTVPNPKTLGKNPMQLNNPLRVKNLSFHETPFGLRGEQRTFMIHTPAGQPMVMQRVGNDIKGRNRRGLRILYFLSRATKRPQRIQWYDAANATVMREQYGTFTQVVREALAKAKK